MIEKLAGLWNTKRWLFWCLLPVTAVAVGIKFYLDYNLAKANGDLKLVQEEDDVLAEKQNKANDEANVLKADADAIEDKIKRRHEREPHEDDDNWHLNEDD